VTEPILTTERLALADLTPADAAFILELVNEPDFIANIRDAGVRDEAGAVRYIEDGPRASYAQNGFGLWRVDERDTGAPVGICGLLKRDWLADPDIGYAILERFRGRGYAVEAARAVMDWARREKGLKRVVAITSLTNAASGAVLEKAGFRSAGLIAPPGQGESKLYAWQEAEGGA
jgi:RimJ/RimL family protein N-acetyltransferase